MGSEDPFRKAAVATIVSEVQGVPGDDRCVVLCGYADEMKEFMRTADQGLDRRFPDRFIFEDYNDEDLIKILLLKAKKANYEIEESALDTAIAILKLQRMKPNFGNGGAVATLLSQATQRAGTREAAAAQSSIIKKEGRTVLVASDFDPQIAEGGGEGGGGAIVDPVSLFSDMIGLDGVEEQVETWKYLIQDAQEEGRDPLEDEDISLNFMFVGPPG
jgi:hypothetical protein